MRSSIALAALIARIALPVTGFSSPAMVNPTQRQQSVHSLEMSNSIQSEAESQTRRQIFFSMLAASGSLILPPNQASAEDSATTVQAVTEAVAAMEDWSNINILKPPTDDREYLAFIMENGLRVVLCSDPQSNEAGAAMDCHVGACSDPKEIRGLAHFCEHMVSLKTIWLDLYSAPIKTQYDMTNPRQQYL